MNKYYTVKEPRDKDCKWVAIIEQQSSRWRYITTLYKNGLRLNRKERYFFGKCKEEDILKLYNLKEYNTLEKIMSEYFEWFL